MNRNDIILLAVFGGMLCALILIAFAPFTGTTSLTMRLWAITDSPISIAVVSTFIAAFAGTWGAQLLAERTANRNALLTESRWTNAALGLAFTIANTYIATKKQQIRALVRDYEAQTAAQRTYLEGIEAGTIVAGTPFLCRLELKTIAAPFSRSTSCANYYAKRLRPMARRWFC